MTKFNAVLSELGANYFAGKHNMNKAGAKAREAFKVPDDWFVALYDHYEIPKLSILKSKKNGDSYDGFELVVEAGNYIIVEYKNVSKVDWYLLKKNFPYEGYVSC